ncbi:MAG: ligase-associated DNA damage response DEXH box helicase [Litorivicinus sp.]
MIEPIEDWFQAQGWTPQPFQRQAWQAHLNGHSGLVQVATGAGKTWAAYGGALAQMLADPGDGLRILYVTPLRAMSRDLQQALIRPLADLDPRIEVQSRTGDTPSHVKQRQLKKPPQILMTTPESLCLMLSYPAAEQTFARLACVIVDEWHELMPNKRGTQTQLALARLKRWRPGLQIWGLSATLGNPEQAMAQLCGPGGTLIQAQLEREIELTMLAPPNLLDLPWAGHYGLSQLRQVAPLLNRDQPTLVFTNTRAQAETWFEALRTIRFDLAEHMALHHGSLDSEERASIEQGLKSGALCCVVCTSSLDLGVDFAPLQRVIQIGSVKGIARLIQRAGRAAHRPGEKALLYCVPTHALQVFEVDAAHRALKQMDVEAPQAPHQPLDVLAQHLVTLALGGGFTTQDAFEEITQAAAYQDLDRSMFDWVLDLLSRGGECLQGYPDYHRLQCIDGRWQVSNRRVALRHRMSMGTIVSAASVAVRFVNGVRLGHIEESFVAKLKPGDRFLFAGRVVAFVRLKDMVCQVKSARGKKPQLPSWGGYRLPISERLSHHLKQVLAQAPSDHPVARAQRECSHLPAADELLIETWQDREGHHLFVYPFAGRLVHEGMAALVAWHGSQIQGNSFSSSINDYGFEVLARKPIDWPPVLERALSLQHLSEGLAQAMNLSELARREFREIARIAGLVFDGYPGARKSNRQLQTSSGLLFDVFEQHDPDNLLMQQARWQVLQRQFERSRLHAVLSELADQQWHWQAIEQPSPLALPLMLERVSDTLSSESLEERVARMTAQWN